MGRKRNAVKKELWRGLSLMDKIRLAQYGDRFFDESADHTDPDGDYLERMEYWYSHKPDRKMANFRRASTLIEKMDQAIKLEQNSFETFKWPGVSNQEEYEIIKRFQVKEAWQRISAAFAEAIQKHDATIFKDVAFILDNLHKAVHPDRFVFGLLLAQHKMHNIPLPTPTKLKAAMDSLGTGMKWDHKTIARLEEYFEIRLPRTPRKSPIKRTGNSSS